MGAGYRALLDALEAARPGLGLELLADAVDVLVREDFAVCQLVLGHVIPHSFYKRLAPLSHIPVRAPLVDTLIVHKFGHAAASQEQMDSLKN